MTKGNAWRQLRAAWVAFHIVAIVLCAIPAPDGAMDRRAWQDPTVQVDFGTWARWFGISTRVFEDRLWDAAVTYMSVRAHIITPLIPYFDLTGTWQPWRMFVAPHRFPSRFQVQIERSNSWQTVYEERSSQYRWRESFFDHERLRSAIFRYSWPSFTPDERRFCQWLSRPLFIENADAQSVRCRFYRAASPSPQQVRAGFDPPGEWIQVVTVSRLGEDTP